jgi:hypothetical protein
MAKPQKRDDPQHSNARTAPGNRPGSSGNPASQTKSRSQEMDEDEDMDEESEDLDEEEEEEER